MVKILLPPSEGKTPPADDDGARLDLDSLNLPELAGPRRRVTEALLAASAAEDAQQVFKVGTKVLDEVRANTELWEAPAAPAHRIYTGVLFDALEPGSLTQAQQERAAADVLIFSGLFGATGFADPIPVHRLSMDVRLSPFEEDSRNPGRLGTFWKQHLTEPLTGMIGDQLVVDCRSSSYANAFRPAPEQTLMVNSFTEKDGRRKVITHFAKHARGLLAGMLVRSPQPPETIDNVVALASRRWTVEVRPGGGGRAHQLDLITQG